MYPGIWTLHFCHICAYIVCLCDWQLMSSELDEILREQNRQDDLCLQHYITELLWPSAPWHHLNIFVQFTWTQSSSGEETFWKRNCGPDVWSSSGEETFWKKELWTRHLVSRAFVVYLTLNQTDVSRWLGSEIIQNSVTFLAKIAKHGSLDKASEFQSPFSSSVPPVIFLDCWNSKSAVRRCLVGKVWVTTQTWVMIMKALSIGCGDPAERTFCKWGCTLWRVSGCLGCLFPADLKILWSLQCIHTHCITAQTNDGKQQGMQQFWRIIAHACRVVLTWVAR